MPARAAWVTCTKKQRHGWRGWMAEQLRRMSAPGSTTGSVAVPLTLLPTKKLFERGAIFQRCAVVSSTGRCSANPRCASGWSARCVRRAGQQWQPPPLPSCMVVWLGFSLDAFSFLRRPTQVATQVAEVRETTLPDGTRVVLGAESQLSFEVTQRVRHATVVGGDAYFAVARDSARPFTVSIGDVQVRVVGTQFEIRRRSGEVSVAVAEGTVDVSRTDASRRGRAFASWRSSDCTQRVGERGSRSRAHGHCRVAIRPTRLRQR